MEFRQQKRILKPTLPNAISIKSELEVCKLIIKTEIALNLRQKIQENNKLRNRLVELQYKYVILAKINEKAKITENTIKKQKLDKKDAQIQIRKLQKQIVSKLANAQIIEQKVKDRKQLIVENSQYLNKIKQQNRHMKDCIKNIESQNEIILNKKHKLEFIVKQILKNQQRSSSNFQTITRQKQRAKQKIQEVIQELTLKEKQLREKKSILKVKNYKIEQQNQSLQTKIKQIEQLIQTKSQINLAEQAQIKKSQKSVHELRNQKFQLQQKLKILKQKEQKASQRMSQLQKSKKGSIKILQDFLQQGQKIFSIAQKLQQSLHFDIEHCSKLMQIQ